jgi:hypothetical protein
LAYHERYGLPKLHSQLCSELFSGQCLLRWVRFSLACLRVRGNDGLTAASSEIRLDSQDPTNPINTSQPIFTWDPRPQTRAYALKTSFQTLIVILPTTPLQYYPWDRCDATPTHSMVSSDVRNVVPSYGAQIFLSAQGVGTSEVIAIDVGFSDGLAMCVVLFLSQPMSNLSSGVSIAGSRR